MILLNLVIYMNTNLFLGFKGVAYYVFLRTLVFELIIIVKKYYSKILLDP